MLDNKYGFFTEDGQEYVITRADTPMPWVNVIANDRCGFTLSQAGSGYSWREHASLNRITRWDQDLIRDEWGKYLYLRDMESGEFWSPTWQPCGSQVEGYQVRHGMGYSVIESRHHAVSSTITYFVPKEDPCELWLLRLRNEGDKPRQLQVFSYLEWLLGAAPDWHREFHRTFIETAYQASEGTLLASKVMWELPVHSRAHWNLSWPYTAFHSASQMPVGFDADKRDFVGRNGSLRAPQSVALGRSVGHTGRWSDPIASLQLVINLAPGETKEIAFSLGAAESDSEALALARRYRDLEAVHGALEEVRTYWQELTSRLQAETPDEALDVMVNQWLVYQTISGRLKGRTAYYQTGGAFGYRDQLQDSLVWLLLGLPEHTLAQIKLHAAHQYQDGIVLHWWHPLADTGHRSDYSDDLLWLALVMIRYLHETGDFAALEIVVPYYDGGEGTLLEHCMRAFEAALNRRSKRGLPLILRADWNDGLNAVGVDGLGESVWMGHFLHYLLLAWAELPSCEPTVATRFRQEAASIKQSVNDHAWDGQWYWRATTDAGALIGSKESPEGKIFLNAQTWAVLGATADPERAALALRSAREHLYSDFGPLLLAPAYTKPDPNIGYLSRYAPGARENGGVYAHAACWAILAERQQNGVDAAYQVWRTFAPPIKGQNPDVYSAEPYVMPGNVAGPLADIPGQAGWTWYTGSAAWNLRAIVEGVLGLEARLEGLRLRAELPEGWTHYRVLRWYRKCAYAITVRRAQTGEAPRRTVNGQLFQGEILPVGEPGAAMVIEVVL